MSETEKSLVATKQFLNRLPNKKYFRRFANKDDGIPEANCRDEDTATNYESAEDED